jgi:biopolymer transport protein TolR
MGMSTGGGGRKNAISEINVTPLVDVMLVLLIVFMVTTPIIVDQGTPRKIEMDLPTTDAPVVTNDEIQTIISIHKDYRITLDTGDGESPLGACPAKADFDTCLAELGPKLEANPKLKDAARVFLMADRTLPYGYVVDIMARIKNAGITNLGMVTNPPEGIGPQ